MFKISNLLFVRNASKKRLLPHISKNYSDNKGIKGAQPKITRRSKLGAEDRLEQLLKNAKNNE